MTSAEEPKEDSALLQEVLNDFLARVAKDEAVPPHIFVAIQKHFAEKKTISANEIRAVLATAADLS